MRVGHVTGNASRRAGGVYPVVRALCNGLHRPPECTVEIFALDAPDAEEPEHSPVPFHVVPPSRSRRFGYAKDLVPALDQARLDLVHLHGLWMYASLAALRWSSRQGGPRVITAHGMLDPWALRHRAWKKRLVLQLYEFRNLREAACLHALCESEYLAIRELGLENPVCVIPNGVALPEPSAAPPGWRAALPEDARILLYLGRLHVKKGLSSLLEAWGAVSDRARGNWHLVIAGWDQGGHREELEAIARRAGLRRLVFVGPQFGGDKKASYAASDAFVLPSLSEGVPLVVLEAWAHGLPVLMTAECNLPEGFAADAALRIAAGDPASIARQLERLFAMPETDRRAVGARGLDLVKRDFAWSRSAAEMAAVYRWVLGGGARPASVRV